MDIKYTPLFLATFLCGVALRSFFTVSNSIILSVLGVLCGMSLFLFFIKEVPRKLFFWLAFFIIFLLGSLRLSIFETTIFHDRLHTRFGNIISIQGTVMSSTLKPNSQRIILDAPEGKTLLVTNLYPRYQYGDVLRVTGRIQEPEAYGLFDTKQILARDQVFSEMIFPEIKKIDFNPPSTLLSYLFFLRNSFEENIRAILPEPHATLANGMLLGDDSALDKNITDAFRKSGTIHILVLSGYNITIVGVFIMAVLGIIFPQSIAWIGSVAGIVAFTAMTGGQAPAVRSAIMALLGLFALRSGRIRAVSLSLLWAAFLMIMWNPMTLRWDRGFQLSFLATLGLLVASPVIKEKLSWLPSALEIRESAVATLSAQIFVVPLLLSWGSEISFLSPIANILIVGAVPLVMLFSFLGGMVAFVSQTMGQYIVSIAYVLISFQLVIARAVASIPISLVFNQIPAGITAGVYAVLFYWAAQFYMKI